MRHEFNSMSRGSGDCKIAGPEYQLMLDSTNEAQKIANAVHSHFKLSIKPTVTILHKCPKRLRGNANYLTGVIKLMGNGCNAGVLLHELAHLNKRAVNTAAMSGGMHYVNGRLRRKRRVSHGSDFKFAQTKILNYWRDTLKTRFHKTTKEVDNIIPIHDGEAVSFQKKMKEPITGWDWAKKKDIDFADQIEIEVLLDALHKLLKTIPLSMGGIVRGMRARGLDNTPENREYALKYAKEAGYRVNVRY